jgi:hypothetical protein
LCLSSDDLSNDSDLIDKLKIVILSIVENNNFLIKKDIDYFLRNVFFFKNSSPERIPEELLKCFQGYPPQEHMGFLKENKCFLTDYDYINYNILRKSEFDFVFKNNSFILFLFYIFINSYLVVEKKNLLYIV